MANFGQFSGEPITRWLSDEKMQLEEDFWYEDPSGVRWDAPKGHKIDGASIPRVLWRAVGQPFGPHYRNASIVHDVYCDWGNWSDSRARDWRDTHRMFYYACRCGGASEVRAKLMFAAVYKFGPKWKLGQRGLTIPGVRSHRGFASDDEGVSREHAPAGPRSATPEQDRFVDELEKDLERQPDMSLDEVERLSDERIPE